MKCNEQILDLEDNAKDLVDRGSVSTASRNNCTNYLKGLLEVAFGDERFLAVD
jgi:hypothetical protein